MLLNNELSLYNIDSLIKSKCNFLFSCIVNNGSKKCIIYCQDTKEINNMKKAIDKLNEYYYLDYEINQITSSDNSNNRTDILDKFSTSNKIQLLFSVRILDECIDIPSCDSIYITYPTQSKIRTIQRLSRCIRIDKKNPFKIGNIYIWCNEYDQILETLSGIKEYDLFFKDKIKINETNFFGDSVKDGIIIDVNLIEKFVIGIKEFKTTSWDDKLEWVKIYIDNNKKRPSTHSEDKMIHSYGMWISRQVIYYNRKEQIMKYQIIYDKWTDFINNDKYKQYFISNDDLWYKNLEKLKKYIDDNDKIPSTIDKNKNTKILGKWYSHQQQNFKNESRNMNIDTIYDTWIEFITNEKYNKYFLSQTDIWKNKLEEIKKYIDNNNNLPSIADKNTKYNKIWLNHNINNYKLKKEQMNNEEIYNTWTEFINNNKYKKYFLTGSKLWLFNIEYIKKYIDENKHKPSVTSKDNNIKYYGSWLYKQFKNYDNKIQIMKNEEIRIIWKEFLNSNKYKQYF